MLFSIIVPVYNVSAYLPRCIDSLLDQALTPEQYEIILVDDCSRDCSLQICREYEEKYPNVKCIAKEKNSGLSDTRNAGIQEASGEYLLFIDSDDYIEHECLPSFERIIRENNEPDVIYGGFHEDTSVSSTICFGYVSMPDQLYSAEAFMSSELSKRNLYAPACFGIYRRKFINRFRLRFAAGLLHEDEMWTPSVLCRAETVYPASIAFYHYVRREDSITGIQDKTQHGLDLITICHRLDALSCEIADASLRRLFDNHTAKLYMRAMTEGRLYRRKGSVDRFYPIRRACIFPDRLKAILFAVSLRLYYLLNTLKDR